eukprot:s130_g34.t1
MTTHIYYGHGRVLQALQLRKRADDAAIMKALAKFNNLFEILRLAGCSIPEATRAEQLWDLAVQAPQVKPPKRSNAWIWYCAGGIVAMLICIFVSVIILQLTQASQGYEVGNCYISGTLKMQVRKSRSIHPGVMSLPFQSHCWQCVQRPDNRRGDFLIGWAEGEAGLDQHAAQVSAGLELDELLPALERRLRRLRRLRDLLVVKDTVCYRRLAKAKTTKADGVLEIGSSLGEPLTSAGLRRVGDICCDAGKGYVASALPGVDHNFDARLFA